MKDGVRKPSTSKNKPYEIISQDKVMLNRVKYRGDKLIVYKKKYSKEQVKHEGDCALIACIYFIFIGIFVSFFVISVGIFIMLFGLSLYKDYKFYKNIYNEMENFKDTDKENDK